MVYVKVSVIFDKPLEQAQLIFVDQGLPLAQQFSSDAYCHETNVPCIWTKILCYRCV